MFRYRVPEELYDLEKDQNCLNNLIDDPKHRAELEKLRAKLVAWMKKTNDPMLEAYNHNTDRKVVDRVILETYGPPKVKKNKRNQKKGKK